VVNLTPPTDRRAGCEVWRWMGSFGGRMSYT
jgi:hypothetical protein